jgi:signal transduction histidine kinase
MGSSFSKPGRVLLAVTLATLAIFGGLVLGLTLKLRQQLRDEVLQREADAIQAIAQFQLGPAEDRLSQFGAEFAIDDMFAAVLESSRLKGVLAVQLFDRRGRLRQAKPIAPDDAANTRWWPDVLPEPRVRFHAAVPLELASPELALADPKAPPAPLLEIAVPLGIQAGNSAALGVARYWIDGRAVRDKFALMDRRLATQAGVAFVGGAALIALVLAWAFSLLNRANRRLLEQSVDLARANEELDFAAKTGALGAISAHLIHGLKNPLAGLEGFVAETAGGTGDASRGDAWHTAMETTRRLRAMVTEVATVLADEQAGEGDYLVPIEELVEAARIRTGPAAESAGVALTTHAESGGRVVGRTANLAGLVLANLITNAIEASPAGGRVALEARRENDRVAFLVSDHGPGLPDAVRGALFRPVRSTKRGGGGVGLAISYRLAKHAGGELELVRSNAQGTMFRLSVPAAG